MDVQAALAETAEQFAAHLRDILAGNLVSVVLFGSVARGEARSDSDMDVLVVCEDLPDGRFARRARVEEAERRLEPRLASLRAGGVDTGLTIILRTRREAERTIPLYLDMTEDARLLEDRGGFFAGVLDRLRARLAALGSERRRRGGARYWVLKPDLKPGEVIEL